MKNTLLLVGLTILLSFVGCGGDKVSVQIIDRAELLLETNPDSSYLLLNSISEFDKFSERLFARWCMLYGIAADKAFREMPYVSHLKRAQTWFRKHGTPLEQARIGLFLGRSFVKDKEHDKAMNVYKSALDIAIKAAVYNQAGYIYCYMADLYLFKDQPQLAAEKYKEAGSYFLKAGNETSYAFALRDLGRMYVYMDSFEVALTHLQKADTIVTSSGDSSAMASICNGLGNIHSMMGQFDLAEEYLLKSICLDSSDVAPSYLALASVFIKSGNFEKARFYLQQAAIPTYNEDTSTGVLYKSYLVAKKENNFAEALHYIERYQDVADSVTLLQNKADILKVEKSYDYLKVENENIKLKVDKQYYFIVTICLVAICLFVLLIYQIGMKRKNRRIHEQNDALSYLSSTLQKKNEELSDLALQLAKNEDMDGSLEKQKKIYQQKQIEVDNLNNELLQLRQEKLFSSAIAQKVINLSKIIVAKPEKSPLSKRDWTLLINKINEVYVSFTDNLKNEIEGITPEDISYCYLALLDLDTSSIATILNIEIESVYKRRLRLRKRLGIINKNHHLYTYLVNKFFSAV